MNMALQSFFIQRDNLLELYSDFDGDIQILQVGPFFRSLLQTGISIRVSSGVREVASSLMAKRARV